MKKIDFEEIPCNEKDDISGGFSNEHPTWGCSCSDYCSCYYEHTKDTSVNKATDTAEYV
jgi:hypothetical protein